MSKDQADEREREREMLLARCRLKQHNSGVFLSTKTLSPQNTFYVVEIVAEITKQGLVVEVERVLPEHV